MIAQLSDFIFPKVIAHRGAPCHAPENTTPALLAAIDAGALYIETDVQLASSGEACLFHDDNLERTSNGRGNFEAQRWQDIQQLDAGSWFDVGFKDTRIPLLAEWLQVAAQHRVGLNIEIKPSQQTQAVVDATHAVIDQYWSEDLPPLIISSKSKQVLHYSAKIAPTVARGWVCTRWHFFGVKILRQLDCVSLHIKHNFLSASRVKAVRDAGFHVLAYTVNDQARAQQLFDWGVSAIFSDNMRLITKFDRA